MSIPITLRCRVHTERSFSKDCEKKGCKHSLAYGRKLSRLEELGLHTLVPFELGIYFLVFLSL